MKRTRFDEQVSGVAALDNDVTRSVYQLVISETWVSRDRASEVLSVARSVAAFHLEKLVDAELLVARFARPAGRTGPGAGRPAKLYGRSDLEIDVSLPRRRYALAGSVLADAVALSDREGTPVAESLTVAARETGRDLGAMSRRESDEDAFDLPILAAFLTDQGYEAQASEAEVALYNCPFHLLADRHRALVCGLNLDLLIGVVEGADLAHQVTAVLAPEPGMCCVRLRTRSGRRSRA